MFLGKSLPECRYIALYFSTSSQVYIATCEWSEIPKLGIFPSCLSLIKRDLEIHVCLKTWIHKYMKWILYFYYSSFSRNFRFCIKKNTKKPERSSKKKKIFYWYWRQKYSHKNLIVPMQNMCLWNGKDVHIKNQSHTQ